MNVEVRFYKRFDMDLFALFDAGYPIAELMREAVQGFAHKQPVHIEINDPLFFDSNDKNTFRTRFVIPNDDIKTINMLKTIKHRCRSNFCKAVLRNALVNLPLTAYFSYDSDYSLYEGLADVDTSHFPRLIHLERDIVDGENPIKRWSRGKIKKFLKECVSDEDNSSSRSRMNFENIVDVTHAPAYSGSETDKKVTAKSNTEAIAAKFGAEISGTTTVNISTDTTGSSNVKTHDQSIDENFTKNSIENVLPNDYNENAANQNIRSDTNNNIINTVSDAGDASVNVIATESNTVGDPVITQTVTNPSTISSPLGATSAGHRRKRFTYDSPEVYGQTNAPGQVNIYGANEASAISGPENVYKQDAEYIRDTAHRQDKVHKSDMTYKVDTYAEPPRMESMQDTCNIGAVSITPPEDNEPDFENDPLMDSLLDMMGDD